VEYISSAAEMLFGSNNELRQIILVTLKMSAASTLISGTMGIFAGIALGVCNNKAKKHIMSIVQTLMGLPPVVAGLIVFLLLSNSGPLGSLRLLFSIPAMVIAQVVLIAPIITGLTAAFVTGIAPAILETTKGMGLSGRKSMILILLECRTQLVAIILTGFARSIAEVGAVQIVGGNVAYKTRVMTTAIMLETNKGNFEFAIVLGFLLLSISLIVNIAAGRLQHGKYNRA